MEFFINGHLSVFPGLSKEEIEARYMAERMKRKIHKKGPAPKLLGNERCQICGHPANGFHYNVLSCEGCKGFFRRTIINGIEYLCKSGNNDCNLFLAGARQRCQKCRILKCLKTGMNPNFVRKRKDDTIRGPYEPTAPKIYRPSVIVESLSRHHSDLMQSLSHPWRVAIFSPTIWHDIKNINDMTEYLSCIQGKIIMSFCMQVPAFRRLPIEIRQELLSKSINELTVLFLSCNFNKKLQIIQFDDTEIDDSALYDEFGVDCDLIDKLFYFFNRQSLLLAGKQDIKLYSILAGIVLFAPDRGLSKLSYHHNYINLIQSIQDECFDLLQGYVERYRSFEKSLLRELTRLLANLRELNHGMNHEMKNNDQKMLQLLLKKSENLLASTPSMFQFDEKIKQEYESF